LFYAYISLIVVIAVEGCTEFLEFGSPLYGPFSQIVLHDVIGGPPEAGDGYGVDQKTKEKVQPKDLPHETLWPAHDDIPQEGLQKTLGSFKG